MFCIILFLFSGIRDFRFTKLKRKCKLETGSNEGISFLIGISNQSLFINYAVHTIHHIIIAIIKMKSGIPFAMPLIIISFIEFYGNRNVHIDRLKVKDTQRGIGVH